MNAFETGMSKLLHGQLSELFFCESQLLNALEKMANAAVDPSLKKLFLEHKQETQGHVDRLRSAFGELGVEPCAFPCHGLQGLLEDGTWKMHLLKGDPVLDHALVHAAQKVEMYEMASYRSAVRLARSLGLQKVAELCVSNLEEEEMANKKLSTVLEHSADDTDDAEQRSALHEA